MMNSTVIIIVAEIFVVLSGIVGLLFYLRWKRKKLQSAEIDKLLDLIDSQHAERQSLLSQHLKENFNLQSEQAKESGGLMVEAEKQFLQQFLKQQIEQTPLTDFYSNLCELLDQYLYFVTSIKIEQHNSYDENPLQTAEAMELVEDEFGIGDEVIAEEEPEPESDPEPEPEPELEKEAEPDWGDAFAESGDEVDEATKEGYESDLKKQ